MSINLEPVILTIIPKLTSSIPTRLIETAQSLLALSAQKVTNLRPEEELVRAYVCARLACERLKGPLDLPPLNAQKLPLPKAQFNRLYKQFASALPERPIRSQDASNNAQPASRYHASITPDVESAVQTLCKNTGVPAANDAILQGLSYVLEKELPLCAAGEKFDVPTAIVAIRRLYLMKQLDGTSVPQAYYKEKTSEFIKALGNFGKTVRVTKAVKLTNEWAIACEGWKWWKDIPAGGHGGKAAPASGSKRKRKNLDSGAGLGTMTRNEYDFLSEKRRKAYAQWKGDIVKRIEQMEALEASA